MEPELDPKTGRLFEIHLKIPSLNRSNGSKYASIIPTLDNGWPNDVKWKRYHKINGTWAFVGYE